MVRTINKKEKIEQAIKKLKNSKVLFTFKYKWLLDVTIKAMYKSI